MPTLVKCRNCGKSIRELDGAWFHTWWIQDPEDELRRVMAGSPVCVWVGNPQKEMSYAQPEETSQAS